MARKEQYQDVVALIKQMRRHSWLMKGFGLIQVLFAAHAAIAEFYSVIPIHALAFFIFLWFDIDTRRDIEQLEEIKRFLEQWETK